LMRWTMNAVALGLMGLLAAAVGCSSEGSGGAAPAPAVPQD
jgi:hypothetical protein